jgi:hypothetical protein
METSKGLISIDARRLPLVEITYNPVPLGDHLAGDYREAFEEYARLARAGGPLLYLIDMRRLDPLKVTAPMRREAARIWSMYTDRLQLVSVATARVITSPVTRGVVTAFDWFTSANRWPCRQFALKADGERWLREQLARWQPA